MAASLGKFAVARIALAGALGLAGVGAWSAAPAATPRQAAIVARQANFKAMGAAIKAIMDQLKTDAPDRTALTANARTIAALAPRQLGLFPRGSGPEAGVKTGALPAIWRDAAGFNALGRGLVTESNKLAGMAATADVTALKAQVIAVGGQCAGCHRRFRAKD